MGDETDGRNERLKRIRIAKQKAGIAPEEKVTLERFEVTRHKAL